jgi:hypothetical protein
LTGTKSLPNTKQKFETNFCYRPTLTHSPFYCVQNASHKTMSPIHQAITAILTYKNKAQQANTHTPPPLRLTFRPTQATQDNGRASPSTPLLCSFNNIYDLQYALLIIPQSLTHKDSHYLKTILHLKQSVHYMKSCC